MGLRTASLLLLCACPRPAPGPAAQRPHQGAAVDPCAADLGGTYLYAGDPSWRYDGRDDGGTLELLVTRSFPDAGVGQAALLVLTRPRDGGGFWGEARAQAALESGTLCPMTFPVRVSACTAAGLTLLAAADGVIGEGCQAPARPLVPAMLGHQLTLADAGGMRTTP